jgi:hypothetical protein
MLNDRALKFLEEQGAIAEVTTRLIDTDEILETSYTCAKAPGKYQSFDPLIGDFDLPGYRLKNGETVYEAEQFSYWCSGLVLFTSLKRDDGLDIPESLWTDEEIDSIIG